jgi:hypothetical protein
MKDVDSEKKLKKATFIDLLKYEQNVQDETYKAFGKWFYKLRDSIDILFQLCYHKLNLPKDINSAEYKYITLALDSYNEVSMSFRSCSVLMEKGFYHDSLNLCRSILENLIKLKYLHDHKDQIDAYESNGKDKNGKKVTINRAMEYVGGKEFKNIYHMLSKFEHKNLEANIMKLNLSKLTSLINLEQLKNF